jgi:hypothetical protein
MSKKISKILHRFDKELLPNNFVKIFTGFIVLQHNYHKYIWCKTGGFTCLLTFYLYIFKYFFKFCV